MGTLAELAVALFFIAAVLFFANYADDQPHEDFEDEDDDEPT